MKLLVITQKIDADDAGLGFFFGWLKALAAQCEQVTAICLERGAGSLPTNTRVFSLGKESRPSRFLYVVKFYWYIVRDWNKYDTVFVHMNEEYVLLAGWLWRLGGKKVTLWRNHARGSFLTRLAVFFSNKVFCTSKSSYTARFSKTVLMPVGVDTDFFKPNPAVAKPAGSVLFLSRIAPVKKQDVFLRAMAKMPREHFQVDFYGDALPKDKPYHELLRDIARALKLESAVSFYSGVPNTQTPTLYHSHRVFINLTPAGSFDKTIVEALACGTLVLTTNTDMRDQLPAACVADQATLPTALSALLHLSETEYAELIGSCQKFVEHHSLRNLITRLLKEVQ